MGVLDNSGALLAESRRLGRTSPLLLAYRAIIESGVLTGEAEAPEFGDAVPEAVAKAAATLWIDAHSTDIDRERNLLDRVVLDGEFLEPGRLDGGSGLMLSTPILSGPKWNRELLAGYKIGTASRARHGGPAVCRRPSRMGASRALSWIAPALPPRGWLTQCAHRRRARASESWRKSPAS